MLGWSLLQGRDYFRVLGITQKVHHHDRTCTVEYAITCQKCGKGMTCAPDFLTYLKMSARTKLRFHMGHILIKRLHIWVHSHEGLVLHLIISTNACQNLLQVLHPRSIPSKWDLEYTRCVDHFSPSQLTRRTSYSTAMHTWPLVSLAASRVWPQAWQLAS